MPAWLNALAALKYDEQGRIVGDSYADVASITECQAQQVET